MKTLSRTLAALCLAATACAALAEDLRVTLSANFELPPLTAGPSTLQLGFTLPEPLTGTIAEGESSFRIVDIDIDAVFNGSAASSQSNLVGWFSEPQFGYQGIDVRLSNLLVPGDLLQMIFVTPVVLFSGPSASPTLERLSLSDFGGGIYYYATGSGASTADGLMGNATYAVSPVPEPAAWWTLPLGLAFIAAVRRRSA
jgi:hypothetical protein